MKGMIKNVIKKDSQVVLRCIPLSAQRRIDEMANNVEETLTSDFQHCRFSIQHDEATFGSSDISMDYVRLHGSSMNDTVDDILFANYLDTESKGETIFLFFYI